MHLEKHDDKHRVASESRYFFRVQILHEST